MTGNQHLAHSGPTSDIVETLHQAIETAHRESGYVGTAALGILSALQAVFVEASEPDWTDTTHGRPILRRTITRAGRDVEPAGSRPGGGHRVSVLMARCRFTFRGKRTLICAERPRNV